MTAGPDSDQQVDTATRRMPEDRNRTSVRVQSGADSRTSAPKPDSAPSADGQKPPRRHDQPAQVVQLIVRGFGRIDVMTAQQVAAVIHWHDRPDTSALVARVRATTGPAGSVGWVSVRGVQSRPAARSWLARTLALPPRDALNQARVISKVLRLHRISG